MNERIIRMAEFSLKHTIYPDVVYPEFDPDDDMFPEAVKNGKRVAEYLAVQTVRIDEDDRFVGRVVFDGPVVGDVFLYSGHVHGWRVNKKYYLKPQENLATFDGEHASADFGVVIREGIEGLLRRINSSREIYAADTEKLWFLSGMELALNAIKAWSLRCAAACEQKAQETSDPARKAELYELADICRHVPAKPARTFREAVQCLYLCFHFLPDSIGAPDRYLRPYFEADMTAGRLTISEAEDMLGELFVMVSAFTPYTSLYFDRGGQSHFAIGGYLPDHSDGFCLLSRLILDTMMKLPLVRPQVTVRWTPDMSYETLYHILDSERKDKGKRIALANDIPRIKAYMEYANMSFEEACRYIIVGCNEPAFEGSIDLSGCITNVARSLTNLFQNRRREILAAKDFDQFYHIYEEELFTDLTRIMDYINMFNSARSRDINVVSSPFIRGCIERALSLNAGGAEKATFSISLSGYVTVVDSLTIVKQFVYDEKSFTMEQLCEMLDTNWMNFECQRQLIINKGHFYGNNYDDSNEMLRRFNQSLTAFAKEHRGLYGTRMLFGSYIGYWQHNVWFGERTGATPDGRYLGDPFVVGISQSFDKDKEGLTSLLTSAACAFKDGILSGSVVFNLKLDEALIRQEENFKKTVHLIESYFQQGGLMLQLNYVSREELLDAKANPDLHRNLRVRVSGFSGYFTNLNEQLQDDIIQRTDIH